MADPRRAWRRPSAAAWACLGAGLIALIGLGTWQLERRAWKHDLIATIAARTTAPPLALGASVPGPEALDYRRVSASGRFDHGRAVLVSSRFHQGRAGVHVITPLLREGLPPVLVNRGWLPLDRTALATRPSDATGGPITVTGIARTTFRRGAFAPENDPGKGFWAHYDPAAMARAMGIARPLPLILEADAASDRKALPKGAVTRIDLPDNHLGYALTWYALAVALVAVFALAHRPGQGKNL